MLSRILEYLKLRRMGYIHRQTLRSLIRKVIRDNTGYSFFEGKNSEYCKNSSLVWKESYSEERSASENKDTMWFDLHSSTLRCTTSLCAVYKSDPLNIIDIGGGQGSVYHESKKLCPHLKFNKWIVIEDKEVVDYARSENKDETLQFYDDISKVDEGIDFDLVFCSGSFFYISNHYEVFSEVLKLYPRCISLPRTAMTEKNEDIFSIQKTSEHQFVPLYFAQKFKVIEMAKSNYHLQFECLETVGAFRVADEIINMYWLFFKRR